MNLNTKAYNYLDTTPQTPVLSGTSESEIYDTYSLNWTDTSSSGGNIYELWESENILFKNPKIYWLNDTSLSFKGRVAKKTYCYKIRSWSASPDLSGLSSKWSNIFRIAIADKPPKIEKVDSFVATGDNDNQYERGLLVNINVVEAYNAPDVVGGTIRITSKTANYDSGALPLYLSEDKTYWTYAWDTTGLAPASDYVVQATLKDKAGQVDSDGSDVDPDLTIALTPTTPPLLSRLAEETDLSSPARGMTVNITRIYDCSLQDEEPFGVGWTHNYNIRLKEYTDGRVDYVMGDGKETTFTPIGNGKYNNRAGVYDELTKAPDDTFKLKEKGGNILNFDAQGKLLSIVDMSGDTINLAYYPDGRLHTITDPNGGVFTFVYKTWSVIGETEARTYTRLDYTQDPTGERVTYTYDNYGNLVRVMNTTPLKGISNYEYTSDTHKLEHIWDSQYGSRYFTYYDDEYGRLKSEDRGSGYQERKTYIYNYPQPGKLTIRDYYGKETVVDFNESGRVISVTNAVGETTTYNWDAALNRVGIKDAEGSEIEYEYDEKGNLIKLKRGALTVMECAYNSSNKPETITIRDGKDSVVMEFEYDQNNGNLIKITSKTPDGDYVTKFEYDEHDQLKKKIDPKGNIAEYTYYEKGLLKEEKLSSKDAVNAYTISYTYDENGNLKTVVDNNTNTTYTYNALNQLTEVKDANGNVTRYEYAGGGNLSMIKDAKGNLTMYNYDDVGRLVSITYADNKQLCYTYDKMGNLTSKTDQNGKTTTYTYDDVYRIKTKRYPDGKTVTYSYYPDGTVKDITDSTGTIHYDYDDENRPTVVSRQSSVISYNYDETGSKTSITYPSGRVVTYDYDVMNRIKTVTLEGTTQTTTYNWEEVSQLKSLELPNGTEVNYGYDNLNRVESLANITSAGSAIANAAYTYDNVGNRLTMTDSEGLHKYTYDSNGQLIAVDYPTGPDEQYKYDAAGNRISVTEGTNVTQYYANKATNRYSDVGNIDYYYDNNGCLIEKRNFFGRSTTTYEYDYENRLTSVVCGPLAPNSGVEGATVDYKYDALGRRTEATSTGTQEHKSTRYIYDRDRVIAETDESGNVIAEYVYGAGLDEVLYMIKDNNFYYYHYDGLGSVKAITDSNGNIVETYAYDVYGKPIIYNSAGQQISTSQIDNVFLFTGKMFDYDTGLYYYRNRYYDPELGRFITPDPLGQEMPQSQIDNPRDFTVERFDFSSSSHYYGDRYYNRSSRRFMSLDPIGPVDGPNLYTYCNNNPVNFIDPTGEYYIPWFYYVSEICNWLTENWDFLDYWKDIIEEEIEQIKEGIEDLRGGKK